MKGEQAPPQQLGWEGLQQAVSLSGGRVGSPRRPALAGVRPGQGHTINPSPFQPSPAACSHQCFKRSPRPVPAAVWVLLGKLAMACKLGTPSPPNLLSLTHSPSPSPAPRA